MTNTRLKKLFLLMLFAVARSTATAQPGARAVVRGQILHSADSLIFLARPRNLLDPTPVLRKVRLNARGEFSAVFDSLRRPIPVQWSLGRQTDLPDLWLEPGDTLTLTVDARHINRSLHFAGRSAAANYYRAAQHQARTDNFYDAPEGRPEPKNPVRMRALADHYRHRAEGMLHDFNQQHPLPPAFRRQEAAVIRCAWGQALLAFAYDYEYQNPGIGPVIRRLPADYYAFLADVPMPQDSLLAHQTYRAFTGGYAAYLLRERRQGVPFSAFIPQQFPWAYDTLRHALPPGPTRNYLQAQTLADLMRLGNERDLPARLTDFQARCTNPELLAALAQQQANLAGTRAGRPAPDFSLTDLNGRPVRLANFRGQLVYLDVWASWCKPCRAEAPALRALQTQFSDRSKQVLFISLSVDADAGAWHRAVAHDKLTDNSNQVQLLGSPAEPALHRLWQQGVPQYWLLSPDGHILDAHAPRPSNPAAAAVIEAAWKTAYPESKTP